MTCRQLQSQHVVVITWAAAKLGQYCPALYDRLLWRAVAVRVQLYPQGVGLLLAACAAVGHRPDSKAVAQLVQVGRAAQAAAEGAAEGAAVSLLRVGQCNRAAQGHSLHPPTAYQSHTRD